MNLKEYIDSLPKDKQYALAITFAKLALPVWDNYADKNELYYIDSVVGLEHRVDRELLSKTVNAVEESLRLNKSDSSLPELREQYVDPVVALQDTDWELPYDVEQTFYAVYNLLDSLSGKELSAFGEKIIYVSINQAVTAIETSKMMTFDEINNLLDSVESRDNISLAPSPPAAGQPPERLQP